MQTVLEVLKKTEAYFVKAGLESPKIDAEWLMATGLGCKRLDLFLQHNRPLTEDELTALRPLMKRRAQREPLQLILGNTDFYGLVINLEEGVLIPRPETEELMELLLRKIPKDEKVKVIDLGTGTGAIALAVAKERPLATVLGIDSSDVALKVAKANVRSNELSDQVSIRRGNWLEGIDAKVDWVISNPPYLTETEWNEAAAEVKDYEPKSALVSSEEGLSDAKIILQQAREVLSIGGKIAFELGVNHPRILKPIAESLGYTECEKFFDHHQRERFFIATWTGK